MGEKVYNWLSKYLQGQKHKVRFNNHVAHKCPKNTTFNTILSCLSNCNLIHLFADNTLLACFCTNLIDAVEKMNKILDKVGQYFQLNKLK